MKEIPLNHGKFAIVDDEDYGMLMKWKWRYGINHKYAVRTQYYRAGNIGKGKTIQMHRVIMDAPKGKMIDHINGNTLDNRKENLRFCNNGQNQSNSISKKGSTSIYKGVNHHANKWRATITVNNKSIHLGTYNTEIEAAIAYNTKAAEIFGEFAKLNVIDGEQKMDVSSIKIREKQSKFIGVSKATRPKGKWKAYIYVDGKQKHIGTFDSEKEAALAYNEKAKMLHKKRLNII